MIPPNCLHLTLKKEILPHQSQVEEALLVSMPACQHCPPGTEPEEQASDAWGAGKGSSVPPLEGSPRLQKAHFKAGASPGVGMWEANG